MERRWSCRYGTQLARNALGQSRRREHWILLTKIISYHSCKEYDVCADNLYTCSRMCDKNNAKDFWFRCLLYLVMLQITCVKQCTVVLKFVRVIVREKYRPQIPRLKFLIIFSYSYTRVSWLILSNLAQIQLEENKKTAIIFRHYDASVCIFSMYNNNVFSFINYWSSPLFENLCISYKIWF